MSYGAIGWKNKMNEPYNELTTSAKKLDKLGLRYFRNPHINIVTIRANQIPDAIARKYELVADTYEHRPSWENSSDGSCKNGTCIQFIEELEAEMV